VTRLRVAVIRFTSCSGCQLSLLNLESRLPQLAAAVDLVRFDMASSRVDDRRPVDLALVEGSASKPEHLVELLELRSRATWLVAMGACALTGGVNALAPGTTAARPPGYFPVQPLERFVRIDASVPGCPPEEEALWQLLLSLREGGLPEACEAPVCMECRCRELPCLLIEKRQLCLGPVTRGGCLAHCPARGIPCEGCRGEAVEANRGEFSRLLYESGFAPDLVRSRLARFHGACR